MVSTRQPTSKSSIPFSISLVTVPNAPITISIIVTFMFHSFFNSLARLWYLSFFSNSFSFILWSAGTAKSTILQVLFFFSFFLFLLIIIRTGLLTEIRWSVCISMSNRSLCVSFSRTGAVLCMYYSYGQIWISCTSPSGLPCRPSRVSTYFPSCKFFTPALDGLSQKSEWQQVSSGFRDSSQYSGRSS